MARPAPMPSGPGRLWAAGLFLVCAGAFWLLAGHVTSTLPYPQHIDEPFVSGAANRMLVEGTLHPYNFVYPSLPRYLAALGMAGGFVDAARHLELGTVGQIGNVGFPYYRQPRVVGAARLLWVLVATVVLALTGVAAWLAFRTPETILLAPLVVAVTPLYFAHAWSYLNVDLIGTAFVVATILACLRSSYRPSVVSCAVVPGGLAGLAAASKYPLGLVLVVAWTTCALYLPARRWIGAWSAAAGTCIAGFVAGVPYSLIDITGFLNGLAEQAYHYAGGHPGAEATPGLAQVLHYGGHFLSEFGPGGLALAAVGAAAAARADWRRTTVLVVFPVCLMATLIGQRVNFTRNVLCIQPAIAMFVAYGVVVAHRWAVGVATVRGWIPPRRAGLSGVVVAVVILAAAVPPWHVRDAFRTTTDSRIVVQRWMAAHLPEDWAVVVPPQLGMDVRPLEARGVHVEVVDFGENPTGLPALVSHLRGPAAVLVPRWGADDRFPGGEAADRLNQAAAGWRVLESFGTHPVLVNYTQPVPEGDPAFSVAVLEHRFSAID